MLASAITMAVAVRVIASGQSVDGVLLRHAASGIVFGYTVTPLSAWFVMVLGLIADTGRAVQRRVFRARRRPRPARPSSARRSMCCWVPSRPCSWPIA